MIHPLLLSVLIAASPVSAEPPKDFEELVKQLGHDDPAVREEANRALLAPGFEKALRAEAAKPHADAEVQARLAGSVARRDAELRSRELTDYLVKWYANRVTIRFRPALEDILDSIGDKRDAAALEAAAELMHLEKDDIGQWDDKIKWRYARALEDVANPSAGAAPWRPSQRVKEDLDTLSGDANVRIRIRSALAQAALAGEKGPALLEERAASDPSEEFRFNLLFELYYRVDQVRGFQAMTRAALSDPAASLRDGCAKVVMAEPWSPMVAAAADRLLTSQDLGVAAAGIRAIRNAKAAPEHAAALRAALKDHHLGAVRREAYDALRAAGILADEPTEEDRPLPPPVPLTD